MTGIEFEQFLRDHLHATADPTQPPGQLDRVAAALSDVRQRPKWLASVRGGTAARLPTSTWPATIRPALILLLVVLLLSAAAYVGSRLLERQVVPPPAVKPQVPFGNLGWFAVSRDGDIYLVDPGTWLETPAMDVEGTWLAAPIWSPDGRWLGAFGAGGNGMIVLDPLSPQPRQLPGAFKDDRVTLSPDGVSIAAADGRALRLVDVASGEARVLVDDFSTGVWSMAWSPDGRWIAAIADGQLVLIDPGSGDVTVLDAAAPFGSRDAAQRMDLFTYGSQFVTWSPDSRFIAFKRWACQSVSCPEPGAVVVISVDGQIAKEITAYGQGAQRAIWSPDGAWLAYSREPDKGLWIVRPDGREVRSVADSIDDYAWSADGLRLRLGFTEGPGSDGVATALSTVDIGTGEVLRTGIRAEQFAWHPLPHVPDQTEPGSAPGTIPPR